VLDLPQTRERRKLEATLAFGDTEALNHLRALVEVHQVRKLAHLGKRLVLVVRAASARVTSAVMLSMIMGQRRRGRLWPMPGTVTRVQPGMAAAVARPPATRTSGSASPWMTRAGTCGRRRAAVRSPQAPMAASWRTAPAGS
jgi:hypothetical protein